MHTHSYTHVFKSGFFSFSFYIFLWNGFLSREQTRFSCCWFQKRWWLRVLLNVYRLYNVYYTAAVNKSSKRWWFKTLGNLSILHSVTTKLRNEARWPYGKLLLFKRACEDVDCCCICVMEKDQHKWIMEGAWLQSYIQSFQKLHWFKCQIIIADIIISWSYWYLENMNA